jgi:PAS domain S-box-containing protein
LYERLDALQQQLGNPASPAAERILIDALNSLQSVLEELEAAEQVLIRRNDELVVTQERLEIERHRYRELFELAPDGYLVTDCEGIIEEANRAAAALLNISPSSLRGKLFGVFLASSERQRFHARLREVDAGRPLRDEEVQLRPYGLKPVSVLLTVVRDEPGIGRPGRLRWVIRDLSERKASEAALRDSEERLRHSQRMESIGRLAGGVAHSFNNLLAAIGFHGELLAEEVDGDELAHVEEIQKAADRGASLAGQLLAFSRRQVLQPRVLRLSRIVAGMEPMLRRLLGEDIDLRLELDAPDAAVEADAAQLEQVILNLAVNARDAMPFGGTLTLRTEVVEHAGGPPGAESPVSGPSVRLTVSDTGIGMDTEILACAFEPFYTTKEQGKGTGLGLATVHGIVLQSGGDIRVESRPDYGTTFVIDLPKTEPQLEVPETPRTTHRPAHGSETVLLVEDEDNIRGPAVEILEGKGYQVLAACHANEALALAERHDGTIHLLISDVVMPGMSGSQLAEHLEILRPEMQVLFMSGYPEDAIAHHGVLDPGQRFLQKPFSVSLLLQTVREILDAKRVAPS